MRIYGEDNTASPPIPGMRPGELVAFKVNGAPAVATPLLYWQDDKASHRIDLAAGNFESQFVLLNPGWNWFSMHVQPAAPLVGQVLSSIDGRYDRVLGETGVYIPTLPPVYNSLTELHAGPGYLTRITGSTSVNLLLEGAHTPVDTPIPLHAGWNWVGYMPTQTLPITVALQSIQDQYQLVLGQSGTYDPEYPEFSNLTHLSPGKAYMIHANTAVTLIYPITQQVQGVYESESTFSDATNDLSNTPYLSIVYGWLTVGGQPASPGTVVEAITPRGDVAGRFVMHAPGLFGFMHIYGEDDMAVPIINGFRNGETITFRVNGRPAVSAGEVAWHNDWTAHPVHLDLLPYLTSYTVYLPHVTGVGQEQGR
jgi:hypothetical protein